MKNDWEEHISDSDTKNEETQTFNARKKTPEKNRERKGPRRRRERLSTTEGRSKRFGRRRTRL